MLKTRYKNYIIIKDYFKYEDGVIYDYFYKVYNNKMEFITNYFNISSLYGVIEQLNNS